MGTQKKKNLLQNRKLMQFSQKILELELKFKKKKVRILGIRVEARIN